MDLEDLIGVVLVSVVGVAAILGMVLTLRYLFAAFMWAWQLV